MIHVIDLFCGAGGFSEGASAAGAEVVLAVDCWRAALDVHAANHPRAEHWCETLGGDPLEFASRVRAVAAWRVPSGGRLHLHASPPCQNLSGANRRRLEAEGLRLVEWTFRVAEALSPDSLTVEQVASPTLLDEYGHLPHRVYDMSLHGVPQIRRRVVFGDAPALPMLRPILLLEVLGRCGYAAREGDAQTNGTVRKGRSEGAASYMRAPLESVSRTVTSNYHALLREGRQVTLPNAVVAELQTFPPSYFPTTLGTGAGRTMLANAVPPAFARLLVLGVRGGDGGHPAPPPAR